MPGSLAVATIVTCAIFATATGIVGAVVTLMGLLAFPPMLRAGYNIQVSAGAVTAGGCLGILIPPSVLLIVYGATAGVSVVQLYAGAFFPGIMLAALYVGYVIVLAKLKPSLMPPLAESERKVALPPFAQSLSSGGRNAFSGLLRAVGGRSLGVPARTAWGQFFVTLLPALIVAGILVADAARGRPRRWSWRAPPGLIEAGGELAGAGDLAGGIVRADRRRGAAGRRKRPPSCRRRPRPRSRPRKPRRRRPRSRRRRRSAGRAPAGADLALDLHRRHGGADRLAVLHLDLGAARGVQDAARLVLPAGAADPRGARLDRVRPGHAGGGRGGRRLRRLPAGGRLPLHRAPARARAALGAAWTHDARRWAAILKDSSFLTAKTSAMVCWLFVGSSIFSAAFALLGGQEIIEKWVLSLGLTPLQFMILAQAIIFILGWPLEWTEIIVIFMPIFIPLLPKFGIDPLFFGLLVALNLQTAFLSPPVAMAAFYLKGVAPPHVTLNQIFGGMLPFMGIQIIALVLLYTWPEIGLWLPSVLYAR